MTNLEKLLEGVEVEWKTLGEVCEFQNGFSFKSNLFSDTGLPIVRITNIDGKNINLKDVKYFHPADYKSGNPLNYSIVKGDILIAMSGATTGKIGYYNMEETAYINQRVGKFIPKKAVLNSRFLYHFLLTKSDFLNVLAGGGAQPNLSSNSLKEKLSIPIPSLSVQSKIVDILDKFTTLETELEAELDCRKRQYEYYRNKLLSFDKLNNIIWMSINDVCENICSGGTPLTSKQEYYQGNIPWLRTQDVNWKEVYDTDVKISEEAIESSSAKIIPRNCVIVAMYGATAAKACINKIPLTTNQACCNLQINGQIANYKYVYYWLCHEYNNLKALGEGSQSNINVRKIKAYKIPIPSLSEQQRIVSILDKFEILTTSISEGLPKEIELRRKQYEYYRNKLLSFPNAKIKL